MLLSSQSDSEGQDCCDVLFFLFVASLTTVISIDLTRLLSLRYLAALRLYSFFVFDLPPTSCGKPPQADPHVG